MCFYSNPGKKCTNSLLSHKTFDIYWRKIRLYILLETHYRYVPRTFFFMSHVLGCITIFETAHKLNVGAGAFLLGEKP